jgi:hypothetical protein
MAELDLLREDNESLAKIEAVTHPVTDEGLVVAAKTGNHSALVGATKSRLPRARKILHKTFVAQLQAVGETSGLPRKAVRTIWSSDAWRRPVVIEKTVNIGNLTTDR